jgi:large subunit ribosomal protein L10
MADLLEGPVAIAFVRPEGDAVVAAKALKEFAKTNPNLVVKGGMLGAAVLSVKDLDNLAEAPPRDVLLAKLAGGFQAPLVKAAGLFSAFTRNFAYGLKAYIDTKPPEESAPSAAAPEPEAVAAPDEAESDHESEDAPPVAQTEPEPATENEATTGEAN